jgi:hypothetical protein
MTDVISFHELKSLKQDSEDAILFRKTKGWSGMKRLAPACVRQVVRIA